MAGAAQPGDGFVEANGLRLHSLKWQADTGSTLPPLLMLHATGFLARLWQPVAEALASRYTVYAMDMRGHGDSERVESSELSIGSRAPYDWHNFVDDVAAFLDALELRGIPIVGHSSGGATAAYLAATRPEYVSALVLIEPIVRPGEYPAEADQRPQMAASARKRRSVWESREEMVESYRKRPTFERWLPEALALYAEHGTVAGEDGQMELKCSPETEAQVYEQSASLELWDVLPDIRCPTLVMRGELTDAYLAMIAEGTMQRIRGARSAVIKGAGHLAPMERPEAVAEAVLGFLGDGNGKAENGTG
jgi:pimeloyl-ACP methyl ester carboxylesterase